MSKPTIHLRDLRWKKALRPYCKTVEAVVQAVGASGDLAIVLADDEFIQELNKHYRGKDKPTNVLSFPNEDEPFGDVVLAFETIEREAAGQGKSFRDHAAHLIVHGILHLMGHDHEDEAQAEKMERKEVSILKRLGIENPYK